MMIQKIRRKFIIISTCALAVVLTTVIGSIIGTSYYWADQEVNTVLTTLANNQGNIPKQPIAVNGQAKYNREDLFQYRYFSVTFNSAGDIVNLNDNHISTVENTEIKNLAQQFRHRQRQGHTFYEGTTYAYKRVTKKGLTTIVFLDESLLMTRVNQIFKSAVVLGIASLALYTLLLALFSKQAIEPIIRAEKRQKEFITNASHELKTPLAIISANNEMVEMLNGESEWTQSNHQQINRLTQLINRLVSLARLDERPEMVIYLTRVFKEQFGLSVTSYLVQLRITQAKRLLRFSDASMEAVAQECGLHDANYFSRLFKKIEGITPGEYRRRW